MIHDTERNREHIDKRRNGVLAAVAKITTLGICNNIMHPVLRPEFSKFISGLS